MAASKVTTMGAGDFISIWSASVGDYVLIAYSDFLTVLNAGLTFPGSFTTQYGGAPLTGFNLTVGTGLTNQALDMKLILNPAGVLATGTVTLPAIAGLRDGQRVTVLSSQTVTALTIAGNGATVIGAPTTVGPTVPFTLTYDKPSNTWYKAG